MANTLLISKKKCLYGQRHDNRLYIAIAVSTLTGKQFKTSRSGPTYCICDIMVQWVHIWYSTGIDETQALAWGAGSQGYWTVDGKKLVINKKNGVGQKSVLTTKSRQQALSIDEQRSMWMEGGGGKFLW